MVYLKAQGKGCPGSHRLALKMSAIAAGEYGNLGLSPGQVRDRIKLGTCLPTSTCTDKTQVQCNKKLQVQENQRWLGRAELRN